MIRLSKLTDYAVVVLSRMSHDAGAVQYRTRPVAVYRRARTDGAKMPEVAGPGLACGVTPRRPPGGYALARPADAISVAEIIAAMDGPIALTACVDGASGGCGVERVCAMRGGWGSGQPRHQGRARKRDVGRHGDARRTALHLRRARCRTFFRPLRGTEHGCYDGYRASGPGAGGRQVQIRLRLGHRDGLRAERPERRDRAFHQRQEERAAMAARLAPESLSRLARNGRADLGDG